MYGSTDSVSLCTVTPCISVCGNTDPLCTSVYGSADPLCTSVYGSADSGAVGGAAAEGPAGRVRSAHPVRAPRLRPRSGSGTDSSTPRYTGGGGARHGASTSRPDGVTAAHGAVSLRDIAATDPQRSADASRYGANVWHGTALTQHGISSARLRTSPAQYRTSPANNGTSPVQFRTSPAQYRTYLVQLRTSSIQLRTSPAQYWTSPAQHGPGASRHVAASPRLYTSDSWSST